MYTVYVLCDDQGRLYKGCTNNLKRRILEHRRGKTKTTSRMKNIKIIHKEEYSSLVAARKREAYLKTAAGRRYLHKILGN